MYWHSSIKQGCVSKIKLHKNLLNTTDCGMCLGTTCVFLLRLTLLLLGTHSSGFPVLPLGEVTPV